MSAAALAVDLVLVRTLAPDVPLRPGTVLPMRVLERHGRHGVIDLGGAVLAAELPDDVEAGARVRVRVEEAAGDRLHLRLFEPPPAPVPALPAVPLPGGGAARIEVTEREPGGGEGGAGRAAVTVRFETEALGVLDLRLEIAAGAVTATVAAPARSAPAASEHAEELREALAAATGRDAGVRVVVRREPVDVYA